MRNVQILSTLSLLASTLLPLATGCQAPIGDGDELDTAADEAEDTAADEADLADEEDGQAIPLTATHRYCTTSGSADSGWAFSGSSSYYDFGRGRISWSGSSVDGYGTLTVSGQINGVTYGALPDTIALTGAIKVNGGSCASVSTVDRDGDYQAQAKGSCTVTWTGSSATTTVTLQDSSRGARFEFIRGSVNDQFYGLTSGSSATSCWWG